MNVFLFCLFFYEKSWLISDRLYKKYRKLYTLHGAFWKQLHGGVIVFGTKEYQDRIDRSVDQIDFQLKYMATQYDLDDPIQKKEYLGKAVEAIVKQQNREHSIEIERWWNSRMMRRPKFGRLYFAPPHNNIF